MKIERILGLERSSRPYDLLEIGCGSGWISHYFATHPEIPFRVMAVDVHDSRVVHEGYEYVPVYGVDLPFPEASFDVVISNHVIEHVGDRDAQLAHLREIGRVLRPGGVGYLAVPNRWMITEPHYRLKFLSWLPRPWRSPYLRWMGKGEFYDCEPLQVGELEDLLDRAGLGYRNACIEGMRLTCEMEMPDHLLTKMLRRVPDSALRVMVPVIPTLIYRVGCC